MPPYGPARNPGLRVNPATHVRRDRRDLGAAEVIVVSATAIHGATALPDPLETKGG
ncbi:hypothetical protein GCM10029978_088990 [Actinoallomurus acanthiterrae]